MKIFCCLAVYKKKGNITMYNKVDFSDSFVNLEKDIIKLWKEKDIIKKSYASNPDGEYFTFYDGPPTANGQPHVGHILTRAIKDIIPRYKSMRGYKVLRKAGWDTHGLPVELEVEKALGIKGKSDIEKLGVEEFIDKCKESVFKYVEMWREMSDKVAFWADMDDPYVTYHNNYIESIWWALKQMWDKGYVYKGHKVMPYCPRCGTSLSSHEVAQGYKDVKDITAFAKFKVVDEPNKYILAWTTTPWTLPSNVALAINKKFTYIEVEQNGEIYILAKDLVKILKDEYTTIREFSGEELLGVKYEQLFPFVKPDGKAFEVIHGDYVTLSDGTGIVHIAPAYGEDDNIVAKQNNIATLHLVDTEGKFMPEVGEFAGMFVKDADKYLIKYLEDNNKLYKAEKFTHSYPHCWRCDTPLLYYPKDSWFIKSTEYRDKLLENNDKINWYPDNIKSGRFGNFLENVIDWAISRDRYWGTPLPIWECECGHREMVGSIAQLKEMSDDVPDNIELHKPYIDNVHLNCPVCNKKMTRVHEVIDCWFDSGSMPFAQFHYPFENKELFENNFPAQFISEAIDQTRGWFYTLHNISTAVFGVPSFENCIVMGLVLDNKGQKMSKSKGNSINPNEILDAVGADATRWHFYSSSAPWVSKRLSVKDVAESQRKFLLTFSNVYSFYVLYADIDKFDPTRYENFKSDNIMDKWILSKLNSLVKNMANHLDNYQITPGAVELQKFVDELSNWYVRRNRARFWQSELNDDKLGAYTTLYKCLVTLAKVASPYVPFISENIYQSLVISLDKDATESIHLCKWPECDDSQINSQLENEMDLASTIVKLGRSARNSVNIKNRQPLGNMLVSSNILPEYYSNIVKEELNIKEITLGADIGKYVSFDIKPNLPVLGKAYGRYIPVIKKSLAEQDQMQLANSINSGDDFIVNADDVEIILNKENLLINMTGLDGFAFASEGSIGVVLDTTITPELKEEGYVREILSKIQTMRKDSGFEVSDNIIIYVANNSMLQDIIEKYKEYISNETLAKDILFNSQYDSYSEIKINDEIVSLGVEKV